MVSGLLDGIVASPGSLLILAAGAIVVFMVPNTARLLEHLTARKVVACLAGFACSLGFMMAQGFSPFLYFQF